MFYDVRISIGMMFTLTGTILTAFGVATRNDAAAYVKSLGIDANLWCGVALLAFGVAVLWMGRRAQTRMEKGGPASPSNSNLRRRQK